MRSPRPMALYPRQNSTFPFDSQLSHSMSVCILICAVRNSTLEFHNVSQCDIEVSQCNLSSFDPSQCGIVCPHIVFLTLVRVKVCYPTCLGLILCEFHFLSSDIHEWLPWIKNPLHFCGLLITWRHFRKMAHTYEYTYVISGFTCDGLTKYSNKGV